MVIVDLVNDAPDKYRRHFKQGIFMKIGHLPGHEANSTNFKRVIIQTVLPAKMQIS